MATLMDDEQARLLVLGGSLLGCGGGGSAAHGLELARLALRLGEVRLVTLDELAPDTQVVTCSAVGAPAAQATHVLPRDFVHVVQLLREQAGIPIGGLIASENGGLNSVNGWLQAAMLRLPVVDAPANGRAHPTGIMGAMGLHRQPDYLSRQACRGGDPAAGRAVEMYVEGSLAAADGLVRAAAVQAGGMVAVARNPVPAAWLREHAAPGALTQAIRLGQRIEQGRAAGGGVEAVAAEVGDALGAAVVARGAVAGFQLETRGGYDVGRFTVGAVEVTFWNEYMTVEQDGRRLATFPDFIATLDASTGLPVTSAELANGRAVWLLTGPASRLILGAGVRDPGNLAIVEAVLHKPMAPAGGP